jgi:hypothetical protein
LASHAIKGASDDELEYIYRMLEREKIDQIAKDVAAANLGTANVAQVNSELMADSEGREALRITIVIPEQALKKISGDAALSALVDMQKRLHNAGEERFAILECATPEELSASDDTKP